MENGTAPTENMAEMRPNEVPSGTSEEVEQPVAPTNENVGNPICAGSSAESSEPDTDDTVTDTKNDDPILIPSKLAEQIVLFLDKARFCFAATSRTSWRLVETHTKEAVQHIEEVKKLVAEELLKPGASPSSILMEMIAIIEEVSADLEHLGKKMLECQGESMCDMIETLLEDMKTVPVSLEMAGSDAESGKFQKNSADSQTEKVKSEAPKSLLPTIICYGSPIVFMLIVAVTWHLGFLSNSTVVESVRHWISDFFELDRNGTCYKWMTFF